jgi:hypothetical protein
MIAETGNEASIKTIVKTGHSFVEIRRLEGMNYEAVFARRAGQEPEAVDAGAEYAKVAVALRAFKRVERRIRPR